MFLFLAHILLALLFFPGAWSKAWEQLFGTHGFAYLALKLNKQHGSFWILFKLTPQRAHSQKRHTPFHQIGKKKATTNAPHCRGLSSAGYLGESGRFYPPTAWNWWTDFLPAWIGFNREFPAFHFAVIQLSFSTGVASNLAGSQSGFSAFGHCLG